MKKADIEAYRQRMRAGEIWWRYEWGGWRNMFGTAVILREWSSHTGDCGVTASTTGRACIFFAPKFFALYVIGFFKRRRRERNVPQARTVQR